MATAARSCGPETRKGRVVATRPLTDYITSNAYDDSTTALRLQRLNLLGIIGIRASMLAGLVWEARHG